MACGQTGWTVHEGELAASDVRQLLALHFAEMRETSPPEACHVLAACGLDNASIRFFALRDPDGALLGIGALRRLDAAHGEIKSMRTARAALGLGVGRHMLHHLLQVASESGMVQVSLETGNHPIFTPARDLYRSAGFVPCAPFGDYEATPFTLFFTRRLID